MKGEFEELIVRDEPARLYANRAVSESPRVVVFHPWWGLNDDVLAYVDRLAEAGFSVLAPDLVRGRIASTIEDAERLATEKDDAHADAVALASIDNLAPSGERVATLGFSMGVAWTIGSAAQRPAVVASVVYYGTMGGPSLAQALAPVLGHFAENDPYEPDDAVQAFENGLRDAGRSVVIHRYTGTGHWFAEPSRDAWRPEPAAHALERTVTFLRQHLEGRPAS